MTIVFSLFVVSFVVIMALAAKHYHDEEVNSLPPVHVRMPDWYYYRRVNNLKGGEHRRVHNPKGCGQQD